MAIVPGGILIDANFVDLKEIRLHDVRPEVPNLMATGENMEMAFQTDRDQVIFTNKRIFVVHIQGMTGKKASYFSFPYSKIQYFGVETAGVLNIESKAIFAFSNGERLQFDFDPRVDIRKLSTMVSEYAL